MQIIQANLAKMGLVTMLYITAHLSCRARFQRKSENLLFYQQSKRKQKYANCSCRLCKTFIANVGFAILPPLDFTHQNKKATLSRDRKYSSYQKCLKLNYYFSSPKKFASLKKLSFSPSYEISKKQFYFIYYYMTEVYSFDKIIL